MKKQRRDQPVEQSLIANLEGQATPPHDFSKTYELSRISGMSFTTTSIFKIMTRMVSFFIALSSISYYFIIQ